MPRNGITKTGQRLLHSVLSLFLVTVLCLVLVPNADAWTEKTCRDIISDATTLLPETLKLLVHLHWNEISGSISRETTLKKQYPHRYYWHSPAGPGQAPMIIAAEAGAAKQKMKQQKNFTSVFSHFGSIAFIICESLNPLHTSDTDSGEIFYYESFDQLMEASTPLFHFRFSGYSTFEIEERQVITEMENRIKRIAGLYKPLTGEYSKRIAAGQSLDFDGRSIPFGIAMISYSTAVNAIADVWVSLWLASGGEIRNPPITFVPREDSNEQNTTR